MKRRHCECLLSGLLATDHCITLPAHPTTTRCSPWAPFVAIAASLCLFSSSLAAPFSPSLSTSRLLIPLLPIVWIGLALAFAYRYTSCKCVCVVFYFLTRCPRGQLFLICPIPSPTHWESNRGAPFSCSPVNRPAKNEGKRRYKQRKEQRKGAGTEEPVQITEPQETPRTPERLVEMKKKH